MQAIVINPLTEDGSIFVSLSGSITICSFDFYLCPQR